MNDVELRELFEQWAAPLRASSAPAVTAIRRRARHRAALIAGATVSALAAVVVVAIAVAAVVIGSPARPVPPARPAFWGSAPYPAPPGQPYVFVEGPQEIIDVATGKVVSRLAPLDHRGMFTEPAVTNDDRLFVLGQQDDAGRLTFAAARIGPSGSVHFGRIMPGISIQSQQIYGMTINPAGTRLVLNTLPPGGATPGKLLLYNLTSGVLLGSWPEAGTGLVNFEYWRSADELAVDWQAQPGAASSGPRILRTTAAFPPGSSLQADTRAEPGRPGFSRGALTADGSMALAVTQAGATEVVREFSVATGALLRTIPIGSARAQQKEPWFCGVLWASPNGRHLLTQCGKKQQAVTGGSVTPIRLPLTFFAQQDGAIGTFAW
jgi:hypothetical protein